MRRALLAVLAVGLWGGAASAKPKVAVLGIEPIDTGDPKSRQKTGALAKSLTRALRDRVGAVDIGYEVAPNSAKDLAELKLLSDCLDEGLDCMASIGTSVNADLLVYGHLEKQRDGYLVTMSSLVVTPPRRAGPFAARRTYGVGGPTDEELRKLAESVLVPQSASDTLLVVEANAPTGTVFVNGTARGKIANGTASLKGVPVGKTVVAIESPGYARYEHSVDVKPGMPTRMKVEMAKAGQAAPAGAIPSSSEPVVDRPGGTARVLFWTSLVATGAGVAAFTITGLKVKSIEDEQNEAIAEWGNGFQQNGVMFPGDACKEAEADGYQKLVDICNRGRNMSTVTNVLIGVTAAAAVATAFFAWKGYISPGSPERDRVAQRKAPPRVVVAPEIYRSGGGVGAVVQF